MEYWMIVRELELNIFIDCTINYLFIDWNPIYKDDAEHFIPD